MSEIWLVYKLVVITNILYFTIYAIARYSNSSLPIYFNFDDVESIVVIKPTMIKINFKSGKNELIRRYSHQISQIIDEYIEFKRKKNECNE